MAIGTYLSTITLSVNGLSEKNVMTQNLQDTAKTGLRGKFIARKAYLRKQEKPQRNNLTLHLKELGKEEKIKSKVSRRKAVIKIRAEINEIETKKPKNTTGKITKTRSWFLVKINKIDELLARLIKKKED